MYNFPNLIQIYFYGGNEADPIFCEVIVRLMTASSSTNCSWHPLTSWSHFPAGAWTFLSLLHLLVITLDVFFSHVSDAQIWLPIGIIWRLKKNCIAFSRPSVRNLDLTHVGWHTDVVFVQSFLNHSLMHISLGATDISFPNWPHLVIIYTAIEREILSGLFSKDSEVRWLGFTSSSTGSLCDLA